MAADSPTSLHSTESGSAKHILRPSSGRNNDRPSYRLFPTVEPTPPASPVSTPKKRLTRAERPERKRSSSFDDSVRLAAARQNVPLKTVNVKRGRKVSITEVKPMSTVQESPLDSPTVPVRYSVLPWTTDDATHNRSSSAPGVTIRDSQTLPVQPTQPADLNSTPSWTSRQAESHPFVATSGLGLSISGEDSAERQPRRQGPSRPKPNLTIKINNEEKPPPPPPKSPRHSRDPSIQSRVSSMHEEPADSAIILTPGSIMRAALVDAQNSPIPTPLSLNAKQESYFPSSGPVRVREVVLQKGRSQQIDLAPPQAAEQGVEKRASVRPNVDKPMPSLPTPSSRFSAHIREVWEAEKSVGDRKMRPMSPPSQQPSSGPTDVGATVQPPSLDLPEKNSGEPSTQAASASVNNIGKVPGRDIRSPTPDMSSRPQSPANTLQTASAGAKLLPILPPEPGPRPRSATPESSLRVPKIQDSKSASSDPIQTLQDLSKQCEALHERYATLRSDRLKLSTAISASLKEDKPGPNYANTLLDQHLSLNAINSSMDICFAKLKSLDCRKEEATAVFIRQTRGRSMIEEARRFTATKSPLATPSLSESGRSTPDTLKEPKYLTQEIPIQSKFSALPARSESPGRLTPEITEDAGTPPDQDARRDKDTKDAVKRTTVILASLSPDTDQRPPVSPISSIEDDKYKTKRIRIKGAKAAKILGLVAQSVNGGAASPGITLPDESSRRVASPRKQSTPEVEVRTKISGEMGDGQPRSVSVAPMPKSKPPPPPRQSTKDSQGSIAESSHTESLSEESEVKTPRSSEDAPFGLKSVKRGMVQSIQVFVDDDILDYY